MAEYGTLRLFEGEVVALTISAFHDGPEGWTLRVAHRRDDSSWMDQDSTTYARLTRAELVDVLDAELGRLLELE